MTQGNRIKSARKRLSMSQAVLARHINVDQSSIAYWECGRTTPKHSRLLALAEVLGVTPEWLQFGVAKSCSGVEIPVVATIGAAERADAGLAASAGVEFQLLDDNVENIAVAVSGNSLAPIYHDGDVLIGPRLAPETALREHHADSVFGMRDGRTLLVRAPAGRALPTGPIADATKISWIMPVTWIRRNTTLPVAALAESQDIDVSASDRRSEMSDRRTGIRSIAAHG